ncbi:class I glutamine amidotransferase-like protein [Podospora fimiseda]|uniref:Class I glutamine amidotransferase-like protein n=1 Tax=Podospora fimiseda TaxID=252190 RepID=A0AAN7BZH2_9PEZI|nr:class I glutamine amidotransferase-like protein [Podospora fimiseda]
MTPSSQSFPSKTIHIGVFIPAFVQFLDLASVDIFASGSHEYLSALSPLVPEAVYSQAPSVKIYYISTSEPSTTLSLTASASILITHHLSSPEVQPGKLDIVLVPGPDPNTVWDKQVTDWLSGQALHEGTDILSVCTGMYLCGTAGIIRGKKVCGPRGLQSDLKKKFADQEAEWVGDELRWVQDGAFWSCGGVTNGNDLVAAYMRANPDKFPGPVAEFATMLTETGDRPQKYEVGKVAFTLGVIWQVLKAVVMGFGKGKKE